MNLSRILTRPSAQLSIWRRAIRTAKRRSFAGHPAWCWLLLVGLTACQPSKNSPPTSSGTQPVPASSSAKSYEAQGEIKAIDLPKRKARILHDEIPGYMRKMTMEFDVRDQSDLAALKPGDRVSFLLKVTEEDGWIESLKRTGAAAAPAPPVTSTPAPRPKIAPSEPLFPGDTLPDYSFTNEFNRPVLLSHYEGQAIAFTFIFTTCPFPTMCPRMSSNFQKAYQTLAAQPDGATNWHFFSITIDPANDSPEVLRRFATGLHYDPSRWSFLTGEESQIELLARHFGLNFYRESGVLNHNLRTVIVTPRGKVHKILVGNEWKPEDLVEEMNLALAAKKAAKE